MEKVLNVGHQEKLQEVIRQTKINCRKLMKAFLFLYPIEKYFERSLKMNRIAFMEDNNFPKRINEIIDARYRQKGYRINWLMFSTDYDSTKPDLFSVSKYIIINQEDNVLTAGISFIEEKIYPDIDFILSQIPGLTELVLGGFHSSDCVEKIAKYVYRKGIQVIVDEDTTDLFFSITSLCGEIPLIRNSLTLDDLGISEVYAEFVIEERSKKPWLVQI